MRDGGYGYYDLTRYPVDTKAFRTLFKLRLLLQFSVLLSKTRIQTIGYSTRSVQPIGTGTTFREGMWIPQANSAQTSCGDTRDIGFPESASSIYRNLRPIIIISLPGVRGTSL